MSQIILNKKLCQCAGFVVELSNGLLRHATEEPTVNFSVSMDENELADFYGSLNIFNYFDIMKEIKCDVPFQLIYSNKVYFDSRRDTWKEVYWILLPFRTPIISFPERHPKKLTLTIGYVSNNKRSLICQNNKPLY